MSAAVVAMFVGGAATAAVIDFTASSDVSGVAGNTAWQLEASGGDAITFDTTDAPGPLNGLAGLNDGLGLNDDEISNGTTGEYITITFDRDVRLTAFSVLDLFREAGDDTPEAALLFAGGAQVATLEATEMFTPGGFGFGSATVDVVGDTFTFRAGSGNDGLGTGDFALASLTFSEAVLAAIPLPASAAMLGTVLLGGMFWGRRNRRNS